MNSAAENLFAQALDLEPEHRASFLAEACEGDPDLRREVEAMLGDADKADDFFAEVACEPELRNFTIGEQEGDVIGAYTLRQQLGEGGFGVVWMAEQSFPIRRMVALKVIKAGMDTKEVLARFEAERQALAMMEHPHIARVLDAGATPTGRPYFAMELVKGIPITTFCDEYTLETRERLVLFMDVCAAIGHAHQKGVIHRDIKPSNVLVTKDGDRPVVKVIDFGIAKAVEGRLTDHTLFTRYEQVLGTPVYMSPEQAGLGSFDLDTRSDIYGLGILLYELLAGVPPFDCKSLLSAGYEEMRRIIREVEPARPSLRLTSLSVAEADPIAAARRVTPERLSKLVAQELDWIVMKAIEKSRDRRYETASAVAQDISRFIADEPVEARPPSAWYLARKFAKRHRVLLQVAAVFFVLLVAAAVMGLWLAIRAFSAEELAKERLSEAIVEKNAKEQALVETKAQSARALLAEKLANDRLDEALKERNAKTEALKNAEAVSRLITDIFQKPSHGMDGRTVTVAAALDSAQNSIAKELADQPVQLALLKEALAKTYAGLGIYHQALQLRQEALAIQRGLTQPDPDAVLECLRSLATAYFQMGQYAEAAATTQELLQGSLEAHGESHAMTVNAREKLAFYQSKASQPNLPQLPEKNAQEDSAQAKITAQREAAKKAAEKKDAELAALRKVHEPDAPEVLDQMEKVASAYYGGGYGTEAVNILEELVRLYRGKYGEDSPRLIELEMRLAAYSERASRGNPIEISRLVEKLQKQYGREDPRTVSVQVALPLLLLQNGRAAEAVTMGEEVLPLAQKLFGPDDRGTAHLQSGLARAYLVLGKTEEGLKHLQECGPNMPDDTFVNMDLAGLQVWSRKTGDYHATRRWMLAYAHKERDGFIGRVDILFRNTFICCLAPLENPLQGEDMQATIKRSEMVTGASGGGPTRVSSEAYRLLVRGMVLFRLGQDELAEPLLKRCVEQVEKAESNYKKNPELLMANFYLSIILQKRGEIDAARTLYAANRLNMGTPPFIEPPAGPESRQEIYTWTACREAGEILHLWENQQPSGSD